MWNFLPLRRPFLKTPARAWSCSLKHRRRLTKQRRQQTMHQWKPHSADRKCQQHVFKFWLFLFGQSLKFRFITSLYLTVLGVLCRRIHGSFHSKLYAKNCHYLFFFFVGGQIWTERPYKLVLNCIKPSYHNNFRFSQNKRSWILAQSLFMCFSSFRSYSVAFREIFKQLAFLGNQNLSFQNHPCKIFASDASFSYALWG